MKIKRFNESNQYLIKDYQIFDFLQDSFIDNYIPVEVKRFPTKSNGKIYTIDDRQVIVVNIGNPERNKNKSEYFSLNDKFVDIKRLINWFEEKNVIFYELNFFKLLTFNSLIDDNFTFNDITKYDPNENLFIKDPNEKYGFVQLRFDNYDWQNYNDEIIQEYTFKDMNNINNFISECMRIFEKNNHHPNYFHWNENKVIISLKTHSTNSVTEKDWIVANKIDSIYEN